MIRCVNGLIAVFLVLLLAACSGGGGSDDVGAGGEITGTGRFIDGPVRGLIYRTYKQNGELDLSGTTSADGEFRYNYYPDGRPQLVSFSYGSILIGYARGADIVTPRTLLRNYSNRDAALINLLRFLQSFDRNNTHADGIYLRDIGGGISIPVVNFDQSVTGFASDAAMLQFLQRIAGVSALISAELAQANFQQALEALGSSVRTDTDGDGIPDLDDEFPNNRNEQYDTDNDGTGNNSDTDDDNDGLSDATEIAQGTNPLRRDTDLDNVLDNVDNCPLVSNSNQANHDNDSLGDACDTDDDNDGVSDSDERSRGTSTTNPDTDADTIRDNLDNCPLASNQNQQNTDGDSMGDACDSDDDGDGRLDTNDNCPLIENSDQTNSDNDSLGNACDSDDDNDQRADTSDNCPLNSNANQLDTDGDGLGDACDTDDDGDGRADTNDNCPLIENSDQTNSDNDSLGNACDTDDDNDQRADTSDNCPLVSNLNQTDTDGDLVGDACDSDDDGDNRDDTNDNCPVNSNADQLDTDGDGLGNACDSDDDGDGRADTSDNCPLDTNSDQTNSDNDSLGNACDTDDDNDGALDGADNCPINSNPDQLDTDGDGIGNVCDPDADVPHPVADSLSVNINSTNNVLNVLANDSFGVEGAGAGAIQLVSGPTHGTATINTNGTPTLQSDDTILYTPTADYAGSDSLVYQISDVSGSVASATVTIDVRMGFNAFDIDLTAATLKTLTFRWSGSGLSAADHFTLLVSRDGNELFSEIPGADTLPNNASAVEVEISTHLIDWANAEYRIEARDSEDNTLAFRDLSLSEETTSVNHIGFFKASNAINKNTGDRFGSSVALSADGMTMAVGARFEDGLSTGMNGSQTQGAESYDSGAVYVFTKTAGGWAQQAYIKASDSRQDLFFGDSLALSADGNTLVVGKFTIINNGLNSAYVFTRSNNVWVQQTILSPDVVANGDGFGDKVDISDDGRTIAVSAMDENSSALGVNGVDDNVSSGATCNAGAVYVFTLNESTQWVQQAYIKPPVGNACISGDEYGSEISLSGDGNTLVVGAYHEDSASQVIDGNPNDNSALNSGAAYVYALGEAGWAQTAYVKGSNTEAGDNFGVDVALSDDGKTLVVGASSEDSSANGVNGDQADNSGSLNGAAYVFALENGIWAQTTYLKRTPGYNTGIAFGSQVDISGDGSRIFVAQAGNGLDSSGVNPPLARVTRAGTGAVHGFVLSEGEWQSYLFLQASNTNTGDDFGWSLSSSDDGSELAVGAIEQKTNVTGVMSSIDANRITPGGVGYESGAVYLY